MKESNKVVQPTCVPDRGTQEGHGVGLPPPHQLTPVQAMTVQPSEEGFSQAAVIGGMWVAVGVMLVFALLLGRSVRRHERRQALEARWEALAHERGYMRGEGVGEAGEWRFVLGPGASGSGVAEGDEMDAALTRLRTLLIRQVRGRIKDSGLKLAELAHVLGVARGALEALTRGRAEELPLEELLRVAARVGVGVQVRVVV